MHTVDLCLGYRYPLCNSEQPAILKRDNLPLPTCIFSEFITVPVTETSAHFFQGGKRNPNPNFLVRIFFSGVGVFHVKGWGPKSSIRPSKPGKSNFLGGISRDFAGISRGAPEKFEKKKFGFNFRPLFFLILITTRDRNLQFRGAVSTGGSPRDFLFFSPVFMRNLVRRAP